MLIGPDKVEAALNFLATASDDIAAARAMRLKAEYTRKRTKAELIRRANESSALMRDAWAETHPEYQRACEAEVEAVRADEYLRDRRNTAEVLIEAWRSEQANQRAGSQFR